MNDNINVYVIGPQLGYARPIYHKRLVNDIEDADIIVLTGGEDVCPETYNRENICSYGSPRRDMFEIAEYKRIRKDQLIMGTCRGAQLLTVLNGGNLVQDVDNHGIWGTHDMIDKKNNRYEITSLHHQMCYPFTINPDYYELLMISAPSRSSHYTGDGIDSELIKEYGEPEVILFKNPDEPMALAIQGHPEMMNLDSPTVQMFNRLLIKYLNEARERR